MFGEGQQLTQNITFERECKSMTELKEFSKKYKKKIDSFKATGTKKPYIFYYIELPGLQNICKIDMSYSKNI